MNVRKILTWLLMIFGEAIILTAFILFRGDIETNILIMNIVVTSLIYGLFCVDILVSWINTGEKSQSKAGSLGLRWFVTWIYALSAIAVMILCNTVFEIVFLTQFLIHSILLFFLLLGLMGVSHASNKVEKVYNREIKNSEGVNEMRKAIRELKEKMSVTDSLPPYFTGRIRTLEENMRFISPSNNQEAIELEKTFVTTMNNMRIALTDFKENEEKITDDLKKCERLYQNRKTIYSN